MRTMIDAVSRCCDNNCAVVLSECHVQRCRKGLFDETGLLIDS